MRTPLPRTTRRAFTLMELMAGVAMTATALMLFTLAESVARKSSGRHAELFAMAEGELATSAALRGDLAEALGAEAGPSVEPRTLLLKVLLPSLDSTGNPLAEGSDEVFYEHSFKSDGTHQLTRRVTPGPGSSRTASERVLSRRLLSFSYEAAPRSHRIVLEQSGCSNLAGKTTRRLTLDLPKGIPARGDTR